MENAGRKEKAMHTRQQCKKRLLYSVSCRGRVVDAPWWHVPAAGRPMGRSRARAEYVAAPIPRHLNEFQLARAAAIRRESGPKYDPRGRELC